MPYFKTREKYEKWKSQKLEDPEQQAEIKSSDHVLARYGKLVTIAMSVFLCLLIFLYVTMRGSSDRNLTFGKWKMKVENHEYGLTDERAQMLRGKEVIPVKRVGHLPFFNDPKLRPYSVEFKVIESGFAFLQSKKYTFEGTKYEDVEWGWKIVLENRSHESIYASGEYSLLDKDGFILTSTKQRKGDDVFIWPGERGIIQGRSDWRMMAESKPYPPSRVFRGDYGLFLRLVVVRYIRDY